MSGEMGDIDKNIVENWKEKLPTLYEGNQPKNISNMDETGVFFRDTTRKKLFILRMRTVGVGKGVRKVLLLHSVQI